MVNKSSLETLVKIAERDNVTDEFRRQYASEKSKEISNNVAYDLKVGISSGLGSILTTSFCAIQPIPNLNGYLNYSTLAVGAGITGAISLIYLQKTIKEYFRNTNELHKMDLSIYDNDFYFIDGKVSNKGTVVEKNFGGKIYIFENLKAVTKIKLAEEFQYGFIDHLILKEHIVCSRIYDQLRDKIKIGSRPYYKELNSNLVKEQFIFERLGEFKKFRRKYANLTEDGFKLIEKEGKEIALLFELPKRKRDGLLFGSGIKKVYYPHP
jgi:hypothetical protein